MHFALGFYQSPVTIDRSPGLCAEHCAPGTPPLAALSTEHCSYAPSTVFRTIYTIDMRLTEHALSVIRQLVRQHVGDMANVYLFGSRVDDTKRGGDIDLYIDIAEKLENKAGAVLQFNAQLQVSLGEQRIDVIVRDGATRPLPIHEQARRTGVRL